MAQVMAGMTVGNAVRLVAALALAAGLSACGTSMPGKAPFEALPRDASAAQMSFASSSAPVQTPVQAMAPTRPETTRAAVSLSDAPLGSEPADVLASFTPYHLTSFEIRVPEELTVSEANLYYPMADIVWRDDPYGNRKQQVAAIFQNSLTKARGANLDGTAVRAIITLSKFHSLTEKTRYTIGGWHEIRFTVTLVDAKTGAVLVNERPVRADLNGLGGRRAILAERQGLGQKERISAHLDRVILAELTQPGGWARKDAALNRALGQI